MNVLSQQVDDLLDRQNLWGYLIDGHGLYAWGRDMAEARRHRKRSNSCSTANWNCASCAAEPARRCRCRSGICAPPPPCYPVFPETFKLPP